MELVKWNSDIAGGKKKYINGERSRQTSPSSNHSKFHTQATRSYYPSHHHYQQQHEVIHRHRRSPRSGHRGACAELHSRVELLRP